MRVIRCDRCLREIHPAQVNRIGYVAINWRTIETDDLEDGNPFERCDFCPDCMKEIEEFIRMCPPIPVPAPDPEQKPAAAADKKKPGKKPLDKGKIGALYDANWTMKDIASEMNCSEERVRQILHELGKITKDKEDK